MTTSTSSRGLPDYYAILQVHPDADDEVIAAAYRQLMKKYHPDVAGEDPARKALHAARSKEINAAFSILRDAHQRRLYDSQRIFFGTHQPAAGSTYASAPPPPRATQPPPPAPPPAYPDDPVETYAVRSHMPAFLAPLALLAAAYYLLPGTYEWEDGTFQEFLPVLLLPVVGVGAFALATGRLSAWIGTSPMNSLGAAVVLLLVSLPMFRSLLRIAAAAGPSMLLLTGLATPTLQHGHIPQWLAWLFAGAVSLMLSARLYVFAVLPTLAACWLLTQLG